MQPTFICFSHNLNYALGWTVIHSLWQAIVIALISGVVMIVLRKKTAHTRYLIGNIALGLVLISAITTFCIYYDFSKEAGQLVYISEDIAEALAANEIPAQQSEIPNPQSEIVAPLSMDGLKDYFNNHIYLIVTMWVMGVALFMLRLLGSISYIYYLRSRLNFPADEYWQEMLDSLATKVNLNVPIELVESALVRSPLVVGYFKPMILFPIGAINKLNTSEVEAILSHELAHVMRHDYVFNIIQSVIEALFFFHPAVWWMSAQIRTERENCADDIAIALCGNSVTYARALVSVQEFALYGNPQMAMAFAGQKQNQLLTRVQRILKQPQNKVNIMEKLIATSILLCTLISLSFGSRFDNPNAFKTNDLDSFPVIETPSVIESQPDIFDDNNLVAPYLRYILNGKKDSVKLDSDLPDGKYNYADNTIKLVLFVEDNWVTKLNLNGVEMQPTQIPNFEALIRKAVRRLPKAATENDNWATTIAPEPPPADAFAAASPASAVSPAYPATPQPPATPSVARSHSQNGAIESYYPSGKLQYREQNGYVYQYYENGNLSYQKNIDGETLSYYENGNLKQQTFANGGFKQYNKNGNLSQSVDKSGNVTQYNQYGKVAQTIDNQGHTIQYDQNGKVSQRINGHAVVTENFIGDDGGSQTIIDSKNQKIEWRAADGAKYILKYNEYGGYEVKMYDNRGNNYKTLTAKNGKAYSNGSEISESELNRMGFEMKNGGLQKRGGYNNINVQTTQSGQNTWQGWNSGSTGQGGSVSSSTTDVQKLRRDLISWQKALKAKAKELKSRRVATQVMEDALENLEDIGNELSDNSLDLNDLNNLKRQLDRVKSKIDAQDCGGCDDNKSGNDCNDCPKDNFDKRIERIETRVEKMLDAMSDCDCKEIDPNWFYWANARLVAQHGLIQSNRNDYGLKMIENEITTIEKQFAKIKAQSKGDKGSKGSKDDRQGDAIHNFFQSLINDGLMTYGKKAEIQFNKNWLKVNGKTFSSTASPKYHRAFERDLGYTPANYAINYEGIITSDGRGGLDISGNLTTSVGKE